MTDQRKTRSQSSYRAGSANVTGSGVGKGDARGEESSSGAAEGLRSTAEQVTDQVKEQVKEQAGALKRQAKETAEDMRERARSVVDQQKQAAVGRVDGIAHALRTASDELRDQGQPMAAEYSRYAAEGLESMARSLERREVGDFVGSVEQFARERPGVFLGGAMVAGFALARFMKSSSARRHQRGEPHSYEPQPTTHGATAGPAGATTTPGVWTPETSSPPAGG
jgi:hypothetical protein